MQHAPKSRGAISKPAHWPQGLSTTCLRHCSDRRGEDRGTSRMQLRKAHWPQGQEVANLLWLRIFLMPPAVYAPSGNCAAYPPPRIFRHIKWRAGAGGKDLTEEDREQFEKTGFRVRTRMEFCDIIACLVEVHFGRSLLTFVCLASLEPMKRGSVRVCHLGARGWYGVAYFQASSASASGIGEPLGSLEGIPATLDQKQSQWIAIHCCASPTGLNLMIHCGTCMWREAAFYVIELHRLGWQIAKGKLSNLAICRSVELGHLSIC